MTDPHAPLEERLQATLDARAGLVDTDTPDLLGAAHAGARARRRRTTVLAAGGAVAAVALAGAVLPQLGSSDEPAGPLTGDPPTDVRGDDLHTGSLGWRQVVFHDITFAVPADWGDGAVDPWCVGGRYATARVQLPTTAQTEVGCSPMRGLGVVVTPTDTGVAKPDPSQYADGTALGQATRAGWTITVSAVNAKTRDAIMDSVQVVQADEWVNGCATQRDVPRLGDAPALAAEDNGPLSVCRYAVGVQGPNLEDAVGSTSTTTSSTEVSTAPLRAAPKGTGPDAGAGTCRDWPEDAAVAVEGDPGVVAWIHYAGCDGHGVDLGAGDTRRLTEDVMRMVMTPGWSGGVIGEIPLPGQGRDPDGSVSSSDG